MMSAMNGRFATAVTALVFVVAGCATNEPEPSPGPSSPTSTGATAAPATPESASRIDARWIGLDTSQPWNWEEVDRTISRDFQQFGFRPLGENELP